MGFYETNEDVLDVLENRIIPDGKPTFVNYYKYTFTFTGAGYDEVKQRRIFMKGTIGGSADEIYKFDFDEGQIYWEAMDTLSTGPVEEPKRFDLSEASISKFISDVSEKTNPGSLFVTYQDGKTVHVHVPAGFQILEFVTNQHPQSVEMTGIPSLNKDGIETDNFIGSKIKPTETSWFSSVLLLRNQ